MTKRKKKITYITLLGDDTTVISDNRILFISSSGNYINGHTDNRIYLTKRKLTAKTIQTPTDLQNTLKEKKATLTHAYKSDHRN